MLKCRKGGTKEVVSQVFPPLSVLTVMSVQDGGAGLCVKPSVSCNSEAPFFKSEGLRP